jgi:ATP-binding cassette subfamily B protein RaxB
MDPGTSLQSPPRFVAGVQSLVERFGLRRRGVPLVLQAEAAECGLACLAMVAGSHGLRISLATLRRRFPGSLRGASLSQILAAAGALHLSGRALRIEPSDLRSLRGPAILHWDLTHFVVLVSVRRGRFVIQDPAVGRRRLRLNELSRHFTGIALELAPTPTFERKSEERPTRLSDFWTRIEGFGRSLAIVAVLSLLLQVLALVAPFYTQLIVDRALVNADRELLEVLAIGFAQVLLMRTCVQLVRDRAIVYLSNLLGFQICANVFGHLIRLPMSYFDKRHVGDVLSRFRSLAPIEELLATGFVSAVLDGVMAIGTLLMMWIYAPVLAAVSLGTGAVFAGTRFVLYRPLRELREENIVARAKEDTCLIESLTGIQAVKLLGAETQREGLWQNRRAAAVNANVRAVQWENGFSAASALLFGAQNLLVVYLAARSVLGGTFTVGMLYAYVYYNAQFSERAAALVDWLIRYRLLDVHLQRLADIIYTAEEGSLRQVGTLSSSLKGRIELRDVSFRYSPSDPCVLKETSLCIEEGSCVGIIGPSGSGKTTLLKLLLGLIEPTSGEILYDGRSVREQDVASYRRQIGAVMQDDHLFEGSLAENISAFDPAEDGERVEAAARAAHIHEDVMTLPMGYRSLVANMGSNLSGGQRQRLLLARAFYREPQLLVLDEGTANLDAALLERVWRSISALQATRIVATHQLALLPEMSQVFVVENGQVSKMDDGRWAGSSPAEKHGRIRRPFGRDFEGREHQY